MPYSIPYLVLELMLPLVMGLGGRVRRELRWARRYNNAVVQVVIGDNLF